jgi:putative hydrolase of the HAD superfamily
MERQTIMFDLDDTLIHCNKYFDLVIEQFIGQLQTWFAADELHPLEIRQKQLDIDMFNVNLHGFSLDHFPQSFVETYHYYSDLFGRVASQQDIRRLEELGHSVFESDVEPYPHMEETLSELQRAGHHLVLYTGGVEQIQWKKIKAMRLESFFEERIFIRQHKDVPALEAIIQSERFERQRTWMIGNSLRTDISPALELGINSIYVPAFTEWEYNIIDIVAIPQGAFLKLNSLQEVPQAINNYIKLLA